MTALLTALALTAFAANSVFCRLALSEHALGAGHFTWIRLLTGVIVLQLLTKISAAAPAEQSKGSLFSALALFIYALTFSLAYISLDTGSGALILFGAVQITMIVASFLSGTRLKLREWLGLCLAFTGFVYLVLPGVSAPPLVGFVLMSVSGIAWGVYTLRGRSSQSPLADTAANFKRTVPLLLVLMGFLFFYAAPLNIVAPLNIRTQYAGIFWAMLSGGLASGVGYTLWYKALRKLSALQAGVLQLLVPVIAAAGGSLLLQEAVTARLTLSAAGILGGVLLTLLKTPAHKTA